MIFAATAPNVPWHPDLPDQGFRPSLLTAAPLGLEDRNHPDSPHQGLPPLAIDERPVGAEETLS